MIAFNKTHYTSLRTNMFNKLKGGKAKNGRLKQAFCTKCVENVVDSCYNQMPKGFFLIECVKYTERELNVYFVGPLRQDFILFTHSTQL